jgi:hypothetical protein
MSSVCCVLIAVKRLVQSLFCPVVVLCLVSVSCCDRAKATDPPTVASEGDAQPEKVVHKMELADPMAPSAPPSVHNVVQTKDRNGFPVGYALDIMTEVCMDKKCKVVEATIHWNAVGYYERLEYPPGKPLTKKEHVPFDADDYAKLDRILGDPNSILATHSLAFLAKPVENDEGIDAWTGATPLTVQQSVVKDAAFTTWVMWRWANGEIVQKLRKLTEKSCTPRYLKHLLGSDDRRCVDFGLKYVMEHRSSDAQFVDDVFRILENGDREHVVLSLRFVSGATKDKKRLHARLIESCCRMKSMYSPIVLDYFAGERDLHPTTLEGLTAHLDRLPYFQIHLILRLLEQRTFFSEKTESDISRLLDGDDFFIARRACEHLMRQELSSETEKKVDEFRKRNRDRL